MNQKMGWILGITLGMLGMPALVLAGDPGPSPRSARSGAERNNLIMTIATKSNLPSAAAITTLKLHSERACLEARNDWLREPFYEWRNDRLVADPVTHVAKSAVCVINN